MNPIVSVVLPVYNCPQYVGEAIESILAQTFSDFELILIDDGSTDKTPAVLTQYGDRRIRLFAQQNRGLAATLNRGIDLSQGRYIARQDQDDVSFPGRLAAQVEFLDAHQYCGLVGTWAEIWHEGIKTGRVHAHPADNPQLQFELLLNNPFVHSSVVIRKSIIDSVGGYCTDLNRQPPEDYELWSRIARVSEVANIPQALHRYREVGSSMSRDGPSPFRDHLVTICAENIAWAAHESPTDPGVVNIAALVHSAAERVQGKPNFSRMQKIFLEAVKNVVPVDQRATYFRAASQKIAALRHQWLELSDCSRLRLLVSRAILRGRRFLSEI